MVRNFFVTVSLNTKMDTNGKPFKTRSMPSSTKLIPYYEFYLYQNCSKVGLTTIMLRHFLVVISLTMTLDSKG